MLTEKQSEGEDLQSKHSILHTSHPSHKMMSPPSGPSLASTLPSMISSDAWFVLGFPALPPLSLTTLTASCLLSPNASNALTHSFSLRNSLSIFNTSTPLIVPPAPATSAPGLRTIPPFTQTTLAYAWAFNAFGAVQREIGTRQEKS